jgi:hypothetical protein
VDSGLSRNFTYSGEGIKMESIEPILGDKNFNLVNEWLASKTDSAFLLQNFKSQIYDDNSKTRYRFIPNNQ